MSGVYRNIDCFQERQRLPSLIRAVLLSASTRELPAGNSLVRTPSRRWDPNFGDFSDFRQIGLTQRLVWIHSFTPFFIHSLIFSFIHKCFHSLIHCFLLSLRVGFFSTSRPVMRCATFQVLIINDHMLGTMAGGAADCSYWIRVLSER